LNSAFKYLRGIATLPTVAIVSSSFGSCLFIIRITPIRRSSATNAATNRNFLFFDHSLTFSTNELFSGFVSGEVGLG
jgi:hypothetical protein